MENSEAEGKSSEVFETQKREGQRYGKDELLDGMVRQPTASRISRAARWTDEAVKAVLVRTQVQSDEEARRPL